MGRSLLESLSSVRVLGVDCNPGRRNIIRELETDFPNRFSGYIEKWSNIPETLAVEGLQDVCDTVIIDLAQKSEIDAELEDLDLRYYDKSSDGMKASSTIKVLDVDNLKKILKIYGGVLK